MEKGWMKKAIVIEPPSVFVWVRGGSHVPFDASEPLNTCCVCVCVCVCVCMCVCIYIMCVFVCVYI